MSRSTIRSADTDSTQSKAFEPEHYRCWVQLELAGCAKILFRVFEELHEQKVALIDNAQVWEHIQLISQEDSQAGRGQELDQVCPGCAYSWIARIVHEKNKRYTTQAVEESLATSA